MKTIIETGKIFHESVALHEEEVDYTVGIKTKRLSANGELYDVNDFLDSQDSFLENHEEELLKQATKKRESKMTENICKQTRENKLSKYHHFVDQVYTKSTKFTPAVKWFFTLSILFSIIKTVFFLFLFNSQQNLIHELELTTNIVKLSSLRVHEMVSIFSDTLDISLMNHGHISFANIQALSDSHGMDKTIDLSFMRSKMLEIVKVSLEDLIKEEDMVNRNIQQSEY